MRFCTGTAIFAFFCLGLLAPSAQAFERRLGARPMGMGDAFTALADDSNALNYNPAGLAIIKGMTGSLEYANLYPGLSDGLIQENHIVYTQTLGSLGGFGVGWNNRSLLGVYHENEMLAGFGLGLPGWPGWLGINLKLFYLGYTDPQSLQTNDYFSGATEKYQWGVDLGVLYPLRAETETLPKVQAGLLVANANEPDLGVGTPARQPFSARLGVSACYQTWDADADEVYTDSGWQTHVGVEKWWSQKTWAARAGIMAGDDTGWTWTIGGSYTFALQEVGGRINYAFNYSFGGIENTGGIHRLSVDLWPQEPAGAPEAAAQEDAGGAEKMARIRAYLLEKITLYFELSDKLEGMKTLSAVVPEISGAEQALHQAVGKLVLGQDLLGFLEQLRLAETYVVKITGESAGQDQKR